MTIERSAMPNFQVFDKRAVPISGEPMVTIQRKGPISINKIAFHAMGKPAFVELLYDPDERIVGFRPLQEQLPHAYPVRAQGRSNTYLIAGHAFLKFYGIPNEVSTRYVAEMFGDVLGVDLKKKGIEVIGHRTGSKKPPEQAKSLFSEEEREEDASTTH
jgi:hypothetical protein